MADTSVEQCVRIAMVRDNGLCISDGGYTVTDPIGRSNDVNIR